MTFIKVILMLVICVLVEVNASACKRKCRLGRDEDCAEGFECRNSNITGKPDCLKIHVCKGRDSGLLEDPTNCAKYYDCSDDSVIAGLNEPNLRMCSRHQLFDVQMSSCRDFRKVHCGKRYEPKNRCDYVSENTPQAIDATCKFLFPRPNCSKCQWPGCGDLPDGWHLTLGRADRSVYCDLGRDTIYRRCTTEGYVFNTDFISCYDPNA